MVMPEVEQMMEMVKLPLEFSAQELLDLLDNDCDGQLSNDEFMLGFYRLISNDQFQHTCNLMVVLNQLRREMVETQDEVGSGLTDLLDRLEVVEKLGAQTVAAATKQGPPE